jgi:hypothetical protein
MGTYARHKAVASLESVMADEIDLSKQYVTGEEIHVGDQVRHMGRPGEIVFVIGRDEYSPDFPREAWIHYGHGFMVRDQFGLFKYDEAEPIIEFVGRQS